MLTWRIFIGVCIIIWALYWGAKLVESIATKNYFFGFFDYAFEEKMIKTLKVIAPLCILLCLTMEVHLMTASVVIMTVISTPYFIWFILMVLYIMVIEPIIVSIKTSIEAMKIARHK